MSILFSLIVMRMTGAVALNPVLGRTGVPAMVRTAMILVFSVLLYVSFGGQLIREPGTMAEYIVMLIREFLFGFVIGFGMELTFLVVRFASAVMDYTMGLSMAQVYDPQYNAQMTITSGLYYALMVLLFFVTDGHVRLIGMFIRSAVMIPFGTVSVRPELVRVILEMFEESIYMGLQFAFPMVAVGLVTETALGVLTRVVPQINIFSVHFDMKIIVGLFMMVFMFGPMADKVEALMTDMFQNLELLIAMMR